MILTIDAKNETLNFELKSEEHVSISVDTSKITDADYLFSRRFIVDTINDQYLQGKLATQWINNDDWIRESKSNSSKYDHTYLPYMNMNLARCSSILGEEKVWDFNFIEVSVTLDNEHEIELYVHRAFKLEYGNTTVYNAVIELPSFLTSLYDDQTDTCDTADAYNLTSNYVFIHACSMWDGLSRWRCGDKMYNEFFYIIQKKDLNRPVLKIHAPEILIKHLIGKKGANISKFKEKLHSAGWDKVNNIRLIGVNSETCGEHFE